jgi:two-component sensor histidine kinase
VTATTTARAVSARVVVSRQTNAQKHAYPEARVNEIEVEVCRVSEQLGSGRRQQCREGGEHDAQQARAQDLAARRVHEGGEQCDDERPRSGEDDRREVERKDRGDRGGRARQPVDVAAVRLDDRTQRVAREGVTQEREAVLRPDRVPGRDDRLPREQEPREQCNRR